MKFQLNRSVCTAWLLAVALLFALPGAALGQTFRGGINGP